MNPPKSLHDHIWSNTDSAMWRSVKGRLHYCTRAELPDSVYMDIYVEVFRPIVRIFTGVDTSIQNHFRSYDFPT